jgi:hypothetical protein
MFSPALTTDPTFIFLTGVAFATFGVANLLARGLGEAGRLLIALAAAAVVVAGLDSLLAGPDCSPAVLLTLILGATLVSLFRSERVAGSLFRLGRFAKRPVFQASFLILIGAGLAAVGAVRSLPPEGDSLDELMTVDTATPNFKDMVGVNAITDCGRFVPLQEPEVIDAERTARGEAHWRKNAGATFQLIQTGPADPAVNCHGWVFAGGQGVIRGAHVETILEDNGYAEVKRPASGDVVVYRDDKDDKKTVLHTGLVRGLGDNGRVLVESKWGTLGTYIHLADETSYGYGYKFYRSPRNGHLLKGLQGPASPVSGRAG